MPPTFDHNAQLSNNQRDALRRAINANAGWPSYSRNMGVTLERSSSSFCIQVCNKLGIDAAAALDAAGHPWRGKSSTWASRAAAILPEPSQQHVASAVDKAALDALTKRCDGLAKALDSANTRIADLESIQPPRGVSVTVNGGKPVVLAEHVHPMFDDLLDLATLRDSRGQRQNVWIAGPTGSGKTHAAEQVAKALGYTFDFHGACGAGYELVGYVSQATGKYQETPFVRQFRDGGIVLLDELDAYSNEATLPLNAALANGMISLADGTMVKRHPDCVVIGCANTFGEGPNATFVGRNKLDAAFLSRFPFKLNWGYDLKLEESISGNVPWARVVQHARRIAQENGFKVVIDPRQTIAGAAYVNAGKSMKRAAELTFLAPLNEEQRLIMVSTIAELN